MLNNEMKKLELTGNGITSPTEFEFKKAIR